MNTECCFIRYFDESTKLNKKTIPNSGMASLISTKKTTTMRSIKLSMQAY